MIRTLALTFGHQIEHFINTMDLSLYYYYPFIFSIIFIHLGKSSLEEFVKGMQDLEGDWSNLLSISSTFKQPSQICYC